MGKRILLISSNSSGRGGGEAYLVHLARGLRSLGCEVHALLSSADYMDGWARKLSDEGAAVHRRRLRGLRHRPLRFLQAVADRGQQRAVAAVCREVAPDAVLVNQQYDEDGLDYVAGALRADAAPVGGLMHMPMTATKNGRPFGRLRGRLLSRWYRAHPYRLILVSEGAQREFEAYYSHPRPTRVVNHGLSFPEARRAEVGLPRAWADSGVPVVGFSGQFVPQKNLRLLVEGWLEATARGCETRLLLVGDGPERAEVERLLRAHAPPRAWHVTGWQEHPEDYLSHVDIYAMTSHFEGCPLSLIEAAGRGLPAVVTNFNGARDVARRAPWVNVVAEAEAGAVGAALASAVRSLPALKAEAGRGADAFRRHFSLRRMAEETLAALDQNAPTLSRPRAAEATPRGELLGVTVSAETSGRLLQ